MDFYKFQEILETGDIDAAIQYKNTTIPDKLYKFISLDEKYHKKNAQKFNSLENQQIWVSSFKELNDPFEFKTFNIDYQKLKKHKWPEMALKDMDKLVKRMQDSYYVHCFSQNLDSMPMWAYYGNNHKGFCIEYFIQEPDDIYEVSYENQRVETSVIVSHLFREFYNLVENNKKEPSQKLNRYKEVFKWFFLVKHKSWEHEKEYRLIIPSQPNKKGGLVSNEDIGIKPNRIIAGLQCRKDDVSRLQTISDKINCSLSQAKMDYSDLNFGLRYE